MDGIKFNPSSERKEAVTTDRKTIFSDDRRYRYTLWRIISPIFAKEYICFICLNPSTADETTDDNTVRRCIRFARREGYGVVCVLNLFALRSTDPSAIKTVIDSKGPENDKHIFAVAKGAEKIVVAWGVHGSFMRRDKDVLHLLERMELYCLGMTKDGHPRHPLYLKRDTRIEPYKRGEKP